MNAWEAADLLEGNQLEAAVEELSAERASFLEEVWPGWRDVNVEAMRNAAWLKELHVGYDPTEQSAADWLRAQQEEARTGTMVVAQRVGLDEAMPGWLLA